MVCACLSMSVAFTVNAFTEVLGVYIGVHLFFGLGQGLSAASINVFISGLVDHNELMGILHGCYGLGSMLSPPIVSLMLERYGFHAYYGLLAVYGITGAVLTLVLFRHETKWKYDYLTTLGQDETSPVNERNTLSLLKDPLILAFSSYMFLYVGVEVATGSWMLTYLRKVKGLEQMSAAIVVSWFWIGLTTGRVVLGFVTRFFRSEYQATLVYSWLSCLFFTIFAAFAGIYSGNDFIGLSKLLALIMGIFIGPLFPTSSVVLMKILPVSLQVSGVSVSSSIGGSGSAVIPFLVGALGRLIGFKYILGIINIALFMYCVVWMYVPRAAAKCGYTL